MGDLKDLRYTITARENLSGKLDRVTGASNRTNRTLGTQNRHLSSLKKNISSAASELPFFSNAMGLATNPILLATGAVAGLGMALNRAKTEAADFNSEFRALHNLNLNKTDLGIANMKSTVFNTAFDNGFNASQTSTAFYDVQSVAGIQGLKAKSMIEKTGMFSRVMQSDFNQTIAGTAQVMDIYGIKVKNVDSYLQSMFSTVLVGKTTFDEMSKVQVEYAGAAAAAGQGYNEANKIFAAFSKISKSADIGANLAKTAFQDLTRKATLDGFKKLGVSVYDTKNEMLSIDVILQNLIPRLQDMDDRTFGNLKEEIGGSEGIKGLLDLAKNSGDELLASMELFDNSEMDYGKAVRAFNGDLNELNKTLKNKTQVLMAEIGQDMLPTWNAVQNRKNDILGGVRNVTSGDVSWYDQLAVGMPFTWNPYSNMFGSQDRIDAVERSRTAKGFSSNRYDEISSGNPDVVGLSPQGFSNRLKEFGELKKWYDESGSNANLYTKEKMQSARNTIDNAMNEFINDYNNRVLTALVRKIKAEEDDPNTTIEGDLAKKTIGSIGSKTINITIEKFQDEININGASFTETNDEMVQQMEEGFLRVLQGVEEAYG